MERGCCEQKLNLRRQERVVAQLTALLNLHRLYAFIGAGACAHGESVDFIWNDLRRTFST